MSSKIEALISKNLQATAALKAVKDQLDILIKHSSPTASNLSKLSDQEKQISAENDALKKQIDQAKKALINAEIKQGIKQQVQIPGKDSAAPAKSTKQEAPANKPPTCAAATAGKSSDSPAPAKQAAASAKPAAPAATGATGDAQLVSKLNMRVGRIVEIAKHPDAESLYVEKVDFGSAFPGAQPKTIISGLVKHCSVEQLQGGLFIFLVNLKPAKLRGIASEGMIMAASDEVKNAVEPLTVPEGAQPGDRVEVEGLQGDPEDVLNPKKKIWETIKPQIRVDETGLARFQNASWFIAGKPGRIGAPTLTNTKIQ